MSNPFAEDRWRAGLATIIEDYEVDQISGVNSTMLSEFLADVSGLLTKLVKQRDTDMPGALDALERSELAALRQVNRLQETLLDQKENKLAEATDRVANLEILLHDMSLQRDRALGVAPE